MNARSGRHRSGPTTPGNDGKVRIERNRISVEGSPRMDRVAAIRSGFDTLLTQGYSSIEVDLGRLGRTSTIIEAAIYGGLRRAAEQGVQVSVDGGPEGMVERFRRAESLLEDSSMRPMTARTRAAFEEIGDSVATAAWTLRGLLGFWVRSLSAFVRVALTPERLKWKEAFYYMEQSGIKAVPIIVTLCWLLGVVLGYMSGFQLKQFAAEAFMPDLVGLAMIWEISPLLAAVLVAGRSGSAFAAELGTMKVRQEVDALRVMGFDIHAYLVVPKMVALLFVMPFLTLLADIFGMLGGMLIGGWYLDMPASIFLSRLELVLMPLDVYWGMAKSLVYGVIVSTVGCFMGMRVRGGAAEVGRSTTSAVVASIFLVILADAAIAILFMHVRPGIQL